MRLRGIGIDLGLSSGASVLVEGDPQTRSITRIETLSVWRRKRARRISPDELYVNTKSEPQDIARFFLDKAASTTKYLSPGVPVGIDWTPREIYWGSNRLSAVLKGFVSGILYRDILVYGSIPLFLPPSYVRDCFELGARAGKKEVWARFLSSVSVEPALSLTGWQGISEHERDGIILGYLAISAFSKHIGDTDGRSPVSTISLPRQ